MPAAAGSLLASVMAAAGLLDAGLHSQVRGVRGNELATDADGAQFSRKLADPAPYGFGLYLSAALEEQRRYGLRLAYASRLLLVARPGTSDIVSTAQYSTGSLLAAWRPSGRIRLALNGTLSRGTQQITPTAQLTA